MARQEPVGSICRPSYYGSGYEDGPEFIQFVEGRDPQIHEVWTFGEDGVTREFHKTAQVDVGAVFAREFATDYLTKSWHRVPMFGRISINGSVEWLGVTDFQRTYGPSSTSNLLAPRHSWVDGGSTTNSN